MTVRVRFAPSPTGYLHVGGARTALYNWLLARGSGGTFLLRSDDTDRQRSTPEFQEDIIESLEWLGLDLDEGIVVGGPHEPYRQSERLDRYRSAALDLVAAGRAYYAFETAEDLDQMRREAQAAGRPPQYDGRGREVDPATALRRVQAGEPAAIRFAVPRPGATTFDDVVRGEMRFDHEHVDDFIILRSDGSPTYHLASSVDDVDFAITHVVRGEDLLSSTPKHILLAAALGAGAEITYAHLPLLRGPDGSKLSKRHGDAALRAYRDGGYLPEALINYLALLGWSPGDDETVVPLGELVARFDLTKVSKNPAVFDTVKLEWMNGVYIRDLEASDFAARVLPFIAADLGRPLTPAEGESFLRIAPLVQERTKLLTEVAGQVRFLFVDEITYDEKSWRKVMGAGEAGDALAGSLAALAPVEPWETASIEAALRSMLDERGLSARKGLQPIRVAIAGSSVSPPLFESLEALGKERSLHRISAAAGRL